MEKLYKSRSETCLTRVNNSFWRKRPTLKKQCVWKKILPAALRSKSFPPQVSPLSLRLMNNNISFVSNYEGDLWLRECAPFRRPSWSKKRFALMDDKLYCYENGQGAPTLSGILMVSDITSLSLHSTDCLRICQADGISRLLRCPSEDVRNSWLAALLAAKAANLLKYQ